ncbi:MAG: hypothetical protein KFB97_06345 [Cyanobium sp. M30B3]|nr:MAG: hypothetical protein KFB97_06345 [Cyanobium sp. M30B3]
MPWPFPGTAPDQFMGLAERYRLIDRLGKRLIDKSLVGFGPLRRELVQGSSLRLAINISPSQPLHDGFGSWLLQQLSESMGLTLVAEGEEDERTRDRLVQAGVRCFQGYLYARPTSPAELIAKARTTAPRREEPCP